MGTLFRRVTVRISGRFADKTASEIVLGSTEACSIPDIKGRFIYKMGNEMQQFQAYYFDDETMLKDVFVEVGDMLTDTPGYRPDGAVSDKLSEQVRKTPEQKKPVRLYKTTDHRKTEEKEVGKAAGESCGKENREMWEADKAKMDEYDLDLDFFGTKD